jgi:hypothetical protein
MRISMNADLGGQLKMYCWVALWPINNNGSISGNQWRTDKELNSELVRKLRFAKL